MIDSYSKYSANSMDIPNNCYYAVIDTPIGEMIAVFDDTNIYSFSFGNSTINTQNNNIKLIKYNYYNIILDKLVNQLSEYFNGKRFVFDLPLIVNGTEFQIKVWNQLLTIDYGQTISYKTQAICIGNPKAIRAVANANSKNKFPIIIPCHRVIGTDGSLTGFAGGLNRKKVLLEYESNYLEEYKKSTNLLFNKL